MEKTCPFEQRLGDARGAVAQRHDPDARVYENLQARRHIAVQIEVGHRPDDVFGRLDGIASYVGDVAEHVGERGHGDRREVRPGAGRSEGEAISRVAANHAGRSSGPAPTSSRYAASPRMSDSVSLTSKTATAGGGVSAVVVIDRWLPLTRRSMRAC